MKGIRRTFAAAALVLASAVAVTAPAQAAHAEVTRSAHTQAAPPYFAYHNLLPREHNLRIESLRNQGYRPITISIYDNLQRQTLYAGTWSTSGRALGGNFPWAMVYNVTPETYQKRFNEYVARGYYPAVVSAMGFDSFTRFAAVFLQRPNFPFIARHGITGAELIKISNEARKKGMILSSVDVYGAYNDRRYIAVWTPNTDNAAWFLSVDASVSQLKTLLKNRSKQGYRPIVAAVSASNRYTTVWRKDPDTLWYAYFNMDAAGYQRHFNRLNSMGYYPVHISAEMGKFAAIWTK